MSDKTHFAWEFSESFFIYLSIILIFGSHDVVNVNNQATTKESEKWQFNTGVLSGTSENQSIKAHGGRRIKTVDFIATVPYDCVKKLKIPRQKTCV